jgi:hypothetical protein
VTRIDIASGRAKDRIATAPTLRSSLVTTDGLLWVVIERPT